MGTLINISTHKGGAGKTTIATNLATALAVKYPKKSICLVDLDGQCGVSITFGKSPNKYIDKSVLSIINKKSKIESALFNNIAVQNDKVLENLYVIFSEPNLRGFDHIINNDISIKNNLIKLIEYLKNKFDFVILDTPPAFSTINIIAFMNSDIIISPFEPERQNIEGSFAVIKELEKESYKNLPLIYLLPIKVKERTIIDASLLQYVEDKINIDFKDKDNIVLSEIRISNSTQFKSTNAKEKQPLYLSKSKAKAVANQKEKIDLIINDLGI